MRIASERDEAGNALHEEALEALAAKHGLCLCHHVHAGPFVNASAALLSEVLRDRDPKHLGAYLDPCHLTVEGTRTGWRQGIELLASHARLMAVKDFQYPQPDPSLRDDQDPMPRYVPLGQGIVRWPVVLNELDKAGFSGPRSFHAEYSDLRGEDEVGRAVADDLRFYQSARTAPVAMGGVS